MSLYSGVSTGDFGSTESGPKSFVRYAATMSASWSLMRSSRPNFIAVCMNCTRSRQPSLSRVTEAMRV